MLEFKSKIHNITKDLFKNSFFITLLYDGNPADFDSLIDKDLSVEIKPYRNKRSLNANAYCWVLITKIADITRQSKQDVYMQMLKDYGQSEMVSMLSNINPKGYFKYYEERGKGFVNDKEFTHYLIIKGSSEYDSYEMSVLLDGIVHEAEQLGIATITPNELKKLKDRWGDEI